MLSVANGVKRCGFKSKLYSHQHVEEGERKVVPFAEWPMVSGKMEAICQPCIIVDLNTFWVW